MSVYVFTKKEVILKKIFPKDAKYLSLKDASLSKHSPEEESLSYIDVSGLNDAELKKILGKLKKICNKAPWGIIDPKGSIKDPVALIIEGASDYLGPSILKNPSCINSKRFKKAADWRNTQISRTTGKDQKSANETESVSFTGTGIKLPSQSSFPGWKKVRTGRLESFYLLYCSISGNGNVALDTRLGEKVFAQVHKRFLSFLNEKFAEADGLLWMISGKELLFLLPPISKCAEAAVEACVRMIASAPLIVMETINLAIPVNFIFALHYGSLNYHSPGKTGTVVSDAVNFIFHLGAKKAEPGRLSVSGEIPDKTIPKTLQDCFVSAGEFEGRRIWHTKKFCYTMQ